MNKPEVRSLKSEVGSNTSCLTSHVLLLTAFSLLTFFIGCQPLTLTPKGAVINKTNPNFLKEAGVDEKTNPHKDENCVVCHIASKELLTKVVPAESEAVQRRFMRTDLIDLCSSCHRDRVSTESEHSVGVPTKLNRENLPLDPQGSITCATTCHDIHTKNPGLKKGLLRHPYDTLCLSCHDV